MIFKKTLSSPISKKYIFATLQRGNVFCVYQMSISSKVKRSSMTYIAVFETNQLHWH